MVVYSWPDSPLLRVFSSPERSVDTEWSNTPIILESKSWPGTDYVAFDVHFRWGTYGTATNTFGIIIESVDSNDQVIQEIDNFEEYVTSPRDVHFSISMGYQRTSIRFKVTFRVRAVPSGVMAVVDEKTFRLSRRRCFIATAAYGSELAPPVQFLREFRDDVVLKSRFCTGFEKILEGYYWFSPPIADAMERHKWLKYFMKYTTVWPFVAMTRATVFVIDLFSGRKHS